MVSADDIKRLVPVERAVERYGFEMNRSGYIICPFHREKTPSLKVYERSWHCYGCGEGGDVISFVQKLFGLSFPQAVVRIAADFGLGGVTAAPSARRKGPEQKADETGGEAGRENMARNVGLIHRRLLEVASDREDLWERVQDHDWDNVPEWYLDVLTDLQWTEMWLQEYEARRGIEKWEKKNTA